MNKSRKAKGVSFGVRIQESTVTRPEVMKALDKADRLGAEDTVRMSHEEIFEKLRRKINDQ